MTTFLFSCLSTYVFSMLYHAPHRLIPVGQDADEAAEAVCAATAAVASASDPSHAAVSIQCADAGLPSLSCVVSAMPENQACLPGLPRLIRCDSRQPTGLSQRVVTMDASNNGIDTLPPVGVCTARCGLLKARLMCVPAGVSVLTAAKFVREPVRHA